MHHQDYSLTRPLFYNFMNRRSVEDSYVFRGINNNSNSNSTEIPLIDCLEAIEAID